MVRALRSVGLQRGNLAVAAEYRDRVWELSLYGAVLPFALLLVLMALVAERLVPGSGAPSAVLLGAGTLLLPFATLFFDHLLSAALGFAAFAVLFHARERGRAGFPLVAAGALAGLAVVVEFPLGIVAVVLAAYAAAASGRGEGRSSTPGASPPASCRSWRSIPGRSGRHGPSGTRMPSWRRRGEGKRRSSGRTTTAFWCRPPRSARGVDVARLGEGPPHRRAARDRRTRRPPARVARGTAAGGARLLRDPAALPALQRGLLPAVRRPGAGTRFLVPALPFLVVPLAYLVRARPVLATGIGLVSAAVMALATIAGPLTGVEYGIGTWLDRAGGSELEATLATRLGVGDPWTAALPFLVLLAIALGLGLARLPLRARMRADGPLLAVLLAGWLLLVLAAPDLLPADAGHGTLAGAGAVTVLLAVGAAALVLARRWGPVALLPLAPLTVLALPAFDTRPRVALLVAGVSVPAAAVCWPWVARSRAVAHG